MIDVLAFGNGVGLVMLGYLCGFAIGVVVRAFYSVRDL